MVINVKILAKKFNCKKYDNPFNFCSFEKRPLCIISCHSCT